MCITADGRALVVKKQAIQQVIESTILPNNLIPISEGICVESLVFIVTELTQLLRDHETTFKSLIIDSLRGTLFFKSCSHAQVTNDINNNKEKEELFYRSSQEIINISTIIERVFSVSREGAIPESAKLFFKGDILNCIIETYKVCLPSTRQLLAEITTHYHTNTRKYSGNYYLTHTLSNLVKYGSSLNPQEFLPIILTSLDTCLNDVSNEKDNLINHTLQKSQDSKNNNLEENKISQSSTSTSVMIFGLLDNIPDE